MSYGNQELTVAEVAVMLEVSERHTVTLFNRRLLAGRQLRSGVWLTSESAVVRYREIAHRGRGRALSSATAWGLLWELSGLRASWLSSSTLSRVREQIQDLSAEEIVRAVAGRTRVHRYGAPSTVKIEELPELPRTGLPAARNYGLMRTTDRIAVYVSSERIEDTARHWALWPDYEGKSALFEYNVPVGNNRKRMPSAVVAADLAVVGSAFERSRALLEIARLKSVWMDKR